MTAVHNWNMTGHPQQSRNDNRTQLMIVNQNSLGAFVAFGKPPVVESEPAANRSCVPIASYHANESAVNSWISSLDAKGLLSKSVFTTTNILTRLGYLGCVLGIMATETIVSTVTSTPDYIQSRPPCSTDADGCGQCYINAETVQLFYWPVSTSADNPKSKLLVTTSGNVTAVYNGTTFTSPSVYLSFQNVWTSKEFCQYTGRNYSDALLKVDPRSLSSVKDFRSGIWTISSETAHGFHCDSGRVNYTDLNKPTSTSASLVERPSNLSYAATYCQTTDHNPILVIPKEIKSLDPDWKNCVIWLWGAQDPPRALTPVNALSGPISTIHPTVTTPAAASIPALPPPVATSRSKQAPAITIESTSADTTRVFKTSVADPPSSVSKSQNPSVIDPASPQPAPKVILTLDPGVLTGNAKGGLSISSNTLSYIGPAMTSPNQVISMNAEGVIVEGTTVADTKHPAFESTTRIVAPITFESMTFSARSSDYVISGQTLHPGSGITISGTSIRLASSATALIVGTHTTALATAAALPTLIIGSQTLTADLLIHYNINDQLLAPGGAVTVHGTPISLTSSPTPMINVHTILSSSATALSVLADAFQPFSPDPGGAYSMGGQKMSTGGDFITNPLAPASFLAIIIGSQTFSDDSSGRYQIMGQTLIPGGVITVSGTPISLASSPAALVIGSSTKILDPSSTAPGLGALIMSALGNEGSIATTSNNTMGGNANYSGVLFAGGSERRRSVSWSALVLMSLCSAIYPVSIFV